jgi:hypothetical protein
MRRTPPLRSLLLPGLVVTLVFAVVIKLASGCLDTKPVYLQPEAGDASGTPCLDCLVGSEEAGTGGLCHGAVDPCLVDPKCAALYACAVGSRCLEQPTLDDKIICGIPCARDAGIVSAGDPAIGQLFVVLQCGAEHCSGACRLGDAAAVNIDAF